jgi:secretion/DNA translocation related TadE-like protein
VRATDRGSATILAVALSAALLCSGVLGLAVIQAAVVTSRAQTAADLSALAGAQAITDACEASAAVAEANGAAITRCAAEGSDVVIEVTVPAPPFVQRIAFAFGREPRVVSARARAGF